MFVGIDIGGTNARIIVVKDLVEINLSKIEKFKLSHDFDNDFMKITQTIHDLCLNEKVEAIGIGIPGTLNQMKTFLLSATNIPEWVQKPFVKMLSKEFLCPVFADNDGVVGSLCEGIYGKGKGRNLLYLTWGTGFGGANVKYQEEKILATKIPTRKYLKVLNEEVGGKGIANKFGKKAEDLSAEEWSIIVKILEDNLVDLADKFKQKYIIVGGGVAAKQKELIQKIHDNLIEKGIEVYSSDFDDDVGLYGAIALIGINYFEKTCN